MKVIVLRQWFSKKVILEFVPLPGETADQVARRVLREAVQQFNRDWPGAHQKELAVYGGTDRTDAAGEQIFDLAVSWSKPHGR
jgi:uncharacterized protein (UPF0128 family)